MRNVCRIVLAFVSLAVVSVAQEAPSAGGHTATAPPTIVARGSYVLGPSDEVTVWVRDLEEINHKPVRIENDGFISLPLVGRVKAAGLTVEQLENNLRDKLKLQILDPQVTVGLSETKSQPVSVLGAVNHPGVMQIQGNKTLVEVLSMAEGLRQDAGYTITVTRRLEYGRIPLFNATEDPTHQYSIAKIDVKDGLMNGQSPQSNIAMKPYDVVSIPKADLVYVVGEVKKSGGFVLNERENISVLQAVALAEGLGKTASPKGARILRASDRGPRTEIPVDVSKILAGKGEDLRLQPNDILFIPNSAAKSAAIRGLQTALEIGTGVAIWRR